MNLHQFYECDPEEQEALIKQATFLSKRKDKHFRYELYQLDSFYIEVKTSLFYNISRDFYAFNDTDYLQPYLAQIALPQIF
jgi:hypothetical protein